MKTTARSKKALILPATVTVVVLAACSSSTTPSGPTCDPVRVADASVVTYMCKDGRTCDPPDTSAIDAGVYQICPDDDDCATLVTYEGQATVGFC
jgi:hypothetical protein